MGKAPVILIDNPDQPRRQRKPPSDEKRSASIEPTLILEASGEIQERRLQRGGFFVEWQLEKRNPRARS